MCDARDENLVKPGENKEAEGALVAHFENWDSESDDDNNWFPEELVKEKDSLAFYDQAYLRTRSELLTAFQNASDTLKRTVTLYDQESVHHLQYHHRINISAIQEAHQTRILIFNALVPGADQNMLVLLIELSHRENYYIRSCYDEMCGNDAEVAENPERQEDQNLSRCADVADQIMGLHNNTTLGNTVPLEFGHFPIFDLQKRLDATGQKKPALRYNKVKDKIMPN